MHTSTKKTAIPYGRPRLTVIKGINEIPTPNPELKVTDRSKAEKKLLMPEQLSGYIKPRKHDCL